MEQQLIQTKEFSIVYGKFKGEDNQELFRCPRSLEDTDLTRYINDHRALVKPMGSDIPFVNDDTADLRFVEGKKLIAYWRAYWRGGIWDGRWMFEDPSKPDDREAIGVDNILHWFYDRFPKGCNWEMEDFFDKNFSPWGSQKRYLIKPFKSEFYKVMVDTTYGNGDYPVRIYVYR